jgi:hypothetical protein
MTFLSKETVRKIIDKILPCLVLPDFDCIPDQTGKPLDMYHLIDMLGNNTTMPGIGDIIVACDSDSMGVQVRTDTRWRVIEYGPYSKSIVCMSEFEGQKKIFYPYNMRRTNISRVWIHYS